jgi:carotenoid cleavage dioxygenase-like enzyme
MSFVFDWTTETSEFVMWDAKTMESTPVLRAETVERVPNGFHTFFVHETELEI